MQIYAHKYLSNGRCPITFLSPLKIVIFKTRFFIISFLRKIYGKIRTVS